jgi:hypothetical protein
MEVNYLRYRAYKQQRIIANDTMMGLLAGSKLASQTLQLTRGSTLRLRDIFPQVPHVHRFNLTTDKAQSVLNNAEELLGVLAVPQVMAIHEDLLVGMLQILEKDRPQLGKISKDAKNATVHEIFQRATNTVFTPASLELFHLIRLARNAHIHNGGVVNRSLADQVKQCSPVALESWWKMTRSRFPVSRVGDRIQLGVTELIGILALTKQLAKEANEGLQTVLSSGAWADLVVEDGFSEGRAGNPAQQLKRLRGIAGQHYRAVSVPDEELEVALKRYSA